MNQRERAARLSKVPLFDGCSRRHLTQLARETRVESVDAGHTLMTEGVAATNLYLVLAGTASVKRKGRVIGRVGPGDVVGEIGVILGGVRTATVTAETPIDWLVLNRTSLRRAIDTVPGLGWSVVCSVTARLSEANGDLI